MDATNYYFLYLGIFIGIVLMGIATFFICMLVIKYERYTQRMKEIYPGYSRERRKEKFEPYYMRDLQKAVGWMNWYSDFSRANGVIRWCNKLKKENGAFLRKEDIAYLDTQIVAAKKIIATIKTKN